MSFNHSAFNCMESLMIICSKSAKVTSKQCLDAILKIKVIYLLLLKVIRSVERKIS